MAKRVLWYVGRYTAFVVTLLLVIVFFVLAAAYLFANSHAGQGWLTSLINTQANTALQSSGMGLKVGAVRGNIPFSVVLDDVALSDVDGRWLRVERLELDIAWAALARGEAHISGLRIVRPLLERQPRLPVASVPATPPSEPVTGLEALDDLPRQLRGLPTFRLSGFQVDGLVVAASVNAVLKGNALECSLTGAAEAGFQAVKADVELTAKHGAETGKAALHALFWPKSAHGPETGLQVRLSTEANTKGLGAQLNVSAILEDLAAPAQAVLKTEARVSLESLAALKDAGVEMADVSTEGPIEARLSVSGSLTALKIEAALDSAGVATKAETVRDIKARLTVPVLDVPAVVTLAGFSGLNAGRESGAEASSAPLLAGTLAASCQLREQASQLSLEWTLDPRRRATNRLAGRDAVASVRRDAVASVGQDAVASVDQDAVASVGQDAVGPVIQDVTASIRLDADAFGVKLQAALDALIPLMDGNTKLESLWPQGTVQVAVEDWKPLSALTGLALRGEAARIDVALEREKDAPVLRAMWAAPSLSMRDAKGADVFAVTEVKGHARVYDPLQALAGMPPEQLVAALQPELASATGKLSVANVHLVSTQASVKNVAQGLELAARATGDVMAEVSALWKPGEARLNKLEAAAWIDPATPALVEAKAPGAQKAGIRLLKPAVIQYGDQGISTPGLQVQLEPSGRMELEGRLHASAFQLRGRLEDVKLAKLRAFVPDMPEGSVRAVVTLAGTAVRPQGDLLVRLDGISVPGGVPPLSCAVTGKLEPVAEGGLLTVRLDLSDKDRAVLGARLAEAEARLYLRTAGAALAPAMDKPLVARLRWDGELAPLWKLVPTADRRLTGRISLNGDVAGILGAPMVSGRLAVEKARFEDLAQGLMLTNIQADVNVGGADGKSGASATASGRAGMDVARLSLRAEDGMKGSLSLAGVVDLAAMKLDVKGNIDNLTPLRRQDVRINLSGDVGVAGPLTAPLIKGSLTVHQGAVDLEHLPSSGIRTLDIADAKSAAPGKSPADVKPGQTDADNASQSSPQLDMTISIPNRFYVRGKGLDCEWKGNLSVTGPVTAPAVVGTLNAVRGDLEFLNKNFKFSHGLITFDGGQPINPRLDISLAYKAKEITANLGVEGTAAKPELVLSSQPSLPRDEILAQVLFGASVQKLSPPQALQLAKAAASLAGIGGGGPSLLDRGRDVLGVDVLRLNTENSDGGDGAAFSSSTLEMGKYVRENIYVGVEQGLGEHSTGVVVEIDLTPSIRVDVRNNTEHTEAGIQWKYDY